MVEINIDGSSLFRPLDLVEGSPFGAPNMLGQKLDSIPGLGGDTIPHISPVDNGPQNRFMSPDITPQLNFLPKNFQQPTYEFESNLFQTSSTRPFDNAKFDYKILGGLVGVIGESHGPSIDLNPLGRGNFLLIGPGVTYFRSSPMQLPGKFSPPFPLPSFVSTAGFNSLEAGFGKAYVRPTPLFSDVENLTWWNFRSNPAAAFGSNLDNSFNFGAAISASDIAVSGIRGLFGSKGRAVANLLTDIGANKINFWLGAGGRASVINDPSGNPQWMKIGGAEFDVRGYTNGELAVASGQKLLEGLSSPSTFFNIPKYEPPARASKGENWLYGRDMPFPF